MQESDVLRQLQDLDKEINSFDIQSTLLNNIVSQRSYMIKKNHLLYMLKRRENILYDANYSSNEVVDDIKREMIIKELNKVTGQLEWINNIIIKQKMYIYLREVYEANKKNSLIITDIDTNQMKMNL